MSIKINNSLISFFILIIFNISDGFAQVNSIDSLRNVIKQQNEDTQKVKTLLDLSKEYRNISSDTVIIYATRAYDIAKKLDFKKGMANAFKYIGLGYFNIGDYRNALSNWTNSLTIFESIGDNIGAANLYSNIGAIYITLGDDEPALYNCLKSLQLAEELNEKTRIATLCSNLGALYSRKPGTYNKAYDYLMRGLKISEELGDKEIIGSICLNIGDLYLNKKNEDSAIFYLNKTIQNWEGNRSLPSAFSYLGKAYKSKKKYALAYEKFNEAFELASKLKSNLDIAESLLGIANVYYEEQQFAQAIKNYDQVVKIAEELKAKELLKDAFYGLSRSYAQILNFKKAYSYMNKHIKIKESIYNMEIDKKLYGLDYTYNMKNKETQINLLQKEKEIQEIKFKKEKSAKNSILFASFLLFVIALILFRFYKVKNKINAILNKQNYEINSAYKELKSMQSQLIQSEKMASLGELTAGIAHEIQNPLNFVKNFSEINVDLIADMKNEISKGNLEELKIIASDIEENEMKIMHHGQRADAIVKGMLQHSRTNSGQKEPLDINALADEYIRLAYHGLRAKDKLFNATIQTDFDELIGKINIIPQDIGRVLLNLYNNAFYAVFEKSKKNIDGYLPKVSVSTSNKGGKVEIRVQDNGTGIPEKIKAKIFQPFFTTKPTGQGTGLGLSLSYDIVKAHGGEMKVVSNETEGATFIILLPV